MLSGATCLVSNGNNISSRASPTMKARQILKRDKRPRPVLVCCFARFAAYDVKGRQVATGNGASCPWQQHHFNVKTWWPNFVAPYSTDNRSNQGRPLPVFRTSQKQSIVNLSRYRIPLQFFGCWESRDLTANKPVAFHDRPKYKRKVWIVADISIF